MNTRPPLIPPWRTLLPPATTSQSLLTTTAGDAGLVPWLSVSYHGLPVGLRCNGNEEGYRKFPLDKRAREAVSQSVSQ